MRSCLIEVGDIGVEDADELVFVQDERVVEALAANTSQEAFAVRIGA